jgi:hypothetical protein
MPNACRRSFVCATVVSTFSPVRASQLAADRGVAVEAGPLERVAVRPTLDMPAPRRTRYVAPEWPPHAAIPVRYRVHLILDASEPVPVNIVLTMNFTLK